MLPLDNFGQLQFTAGATAKGGQTVNISQAGAQPITMINSSGKVLASPSSLTNGGGSFSVTRNPPPSSAPGATSAAVPVQVPAPFGAKS